MATTAKASPKDAAHIELSDCIATSQAGAVQERVTALCQKFPELRAAIVGPLISSAQTFNAIRGQPYSYQLFLLRGAATNWELVEGNLPDGLTLNPSTGLISGIPTAIAAVSNAFTVRANSPYGNDYEHLSIEVDDACFSPTVIVPPFDPRASVGQPAVWQLGATGSGPMAWAVTAGPLPGGLTLNPATGVVSGTPTESGVTQVTCEATNACGSDEKTFTLSIFA